MITTLLPGTAERVRSIVEAEFGPGYWTGFQRYMCEDSPYAGREWRFGGELGTGGKVHLSGGRLYVSAYPEHITDDLSERMQRVTHDLMQALAEMGSAPLPRTLAPNTNEEN